MPGDSPEIPLVVGDSVCRAVWGRSLHYNYFHVLRHISSGTGHQALPDASEGHIDIGKYNLTGGEEINLCVN